MARDLGTKYVCFKCSTRFYDLKKPVPACPKCGADQREAPQPKSGSSRSRPAPATREPEEVELPAAEDEETDAAEEEAEEADDE